MVHAADIGSVVIALMNAQCYQAVKYLSSKQVIRATMPRRTRGKAWDKRDTRRCLNLTIGWPNYRERLFLKKNGVLKEIQLRDFPKPR